MSGEFVSTRWRLRPWKPVAAGMVLVMALMWINGPGLRWLGPRVVAKVAQGVGMKVEMKVDGTLAGGFALREVELKPSDGALKRFTVEELVLDYRLAGILRGQVDGVRARMIHADVTLGTVEQVDDGGLPDFASIGGLLRKVRGHLIDMEVEMHGVTASVMRQDGLMIELEESFYRHEAGLDLMMLGLGAVDVAGERVLEAQSIEIDWKEERIGLDRMMLHPALAVTDLGVLIPMAGGVLVEGMVEVAEAKFELKSAPEQGMVEMRFRDGRLTANALNQAFDLELPVEAELTSLSLILSDALPDPGGATATLEVLVERVGLGEWRLDELSLDVVLSAGDVRLVTRAALGVAEAKFEATAQVNREDWSLSEMRGGIDVADLKPWLKELRFFQEENTSFPPSSLRGDLDMDWVEGRQIDAAVIKMMLIPSDEAMASGVIFEGRWNPAGKVVAQILADGLTANVEADLKTRRYVGEVLMQGFKTDRHAPWLGTTGLVLPGSGEVNLFWSGGGSLQADGHAGTLKLGEMVWKKAGTDDLRGSLDARYEWPGRVAVDRLEARRADQSISGRMAWEAGMLDIDSLIWFDDEDQKLATIEGRLPVPKDLANWKESLINDTREMNLMIRTAVLGFEKIQVWLPSLDVIDASATAQVDVSFSGTINQPEVGVSVAAFGMKAAAASAMPMADLNLQATGSGERLNITGELKSPDFDPVVLRAALPFEPMKWLEDMDSLMATELEADVVLPRVDLSRFSGILPMLQNLTGVVKGNVRVRGSLGEPDLRGQIGLERGSCRFVNDRFPPITGVRAEVIFDGGGARIDRLEAAVAGGSLGGDGVYLFDDRAIDLRLRGNAIPLLRNDSLILRTDADLKLVGSIERMVISGTVSLVDSLFFKDIELLPIGAPFTAPNAASLPKMDAGSPTASLPEPLASWSLDLKCRTKDPLLIRGNLATGQIVADLRVRGTLGDPRPAGHIRLHEGVAVLPFSTMVIPKATLVFSEANGLDPVIELRGSSEPRPYVVNVFAYGRMSDPKLVLSSSPPLPENEIMTLLATGTTTAGLEDPQFASARAIQLFAEELRRGRIPMGNQLRPLLGFFDQVDFTVGQQDPYSTEAYSTATLKLHDRWFLSAGMSEGGNSRTFAIWRLRFR